MARSIGLPADLVADAEAASMKEEKLESMWVRLEESSHQQGEQMDVDDPAKKGVSASFHFSESDLVEFSSQPTSTYQPIHSLPLIRPVSLVLDGMIIIQDKDKSLIAQEAFLATSP